jgi:hypothetical protein
MGKTFMSITAEHSWNETIKCNGLEQKSSTKGNKLTKKMKEFVFIRTAEHVISQPSLDMSSI